MQIKHQHGNKALLLVIPLICFAAFAGALPRDTDVGKCKTEEETCDTQVNTTETLSRNRGIALIGGIVAGVVLFGLLCSGIGCWYKRSKKAAGVVADSDGSPTVEKMANGNVID